MGRGRENRGIEAFGGFVRVEILDGPRLNLSSSNILYMETPLVRNVFKGA